MEYTKFKTITINVLSVLTTFIIEITKRRFTFHSLIRTLVVEDFTAYIPNTSGTLGSRVSAE